MSIIVFPKDCAKISTKVDLKIPSEIDYEHHVITAIGLAYSNYYCVPFKAPFELDGEIKIADVAIIAKNFSHWFIVEVELASHSLNGHVLPQVRTFRYGRPLDSCVSILSKATNINYEQAKTLLTLVPRETVVIVNEVKPKWYTAISAVPARLISIELYQSSLNLFGYLINGNLFAIKKSIGFGTYRTVDQAIIFPRNLSLTIERFQAKDNLGNVNWYNVSKSKISTWIMRETGDFPASDKDSVQLIMDFNNNFLFRTNTKFN